MSGHETDKVTGEYQRLFRVPKSALIDFILRHRHLGEPIDQALSSICGPATDITANDLAEQQHSEIVQVIQQCAAFT